MDIIQVISIILSAIAISISSYRLGFDHGYMKAKREE